MKMYIKITFLILTLTLVLAVACTNRSTNNNNEFEIAEGGISPQVHVFFYELLVQIRNEFQLMEMAVYVPKVAFDAAHGGESKPVPTLVLLAPQNGDQYYYFNHGLKEIADEMISSGEIQPMVIACISNDKIFGGYFYAGNSPGAGNYDTLIGGTLLDYLHYAYPFTINSPDKRGIGGVGMGSYGAFRAALLNPGVFSSISVTDGPLDFNGADGNSGLIPLFVDALTEQGLLNGNINQFDTLSDLSRLFVGGALAFSPRYTAITYSLDTVENLSTPIENDSTVNITITSRDTLFSVPNDETLVSALITVSENDFDFHLPFNNTGTANTGIWNRWLSNNLETMLESSSLDGVNMWIATSDEVNFANYYDQTQSWIATLNNASLPVVVKTYEGYNGNPAEGGQYVYDLLREMLKFHSENFGD